MSRMLYLCVSFQRVLRGLLVRHACTELYESPSLTHSSQRTNGFVSPWPICYFGVLLCLRHIVNFRLQLSPMVCVDETYLVRKPCSKKFELHWAENLEPIGCSSVARAVRGRVRGHLFGYAGRIPVGANCNNARAPCIWVRTPGSSARRISARRGWGVGSLL